MGIRVSAYVSAGYNFSDEGTGLKILVVDDDPQVCEVAAVSLQMRWPDAAVFIAATGSEGIDLAGREVPDVIILDIGLPDMSGFEVCRRLRDLIVAPVLILTVQDAETDKVRGLDLGADDYITKPFDQLELLARVNAVLRRSRLSRSGASGQHFRSGRLFVDFGTREVRVNGALVELPPIEYSLLYHLVKQANRVVPHRLLIERVWGREYTDHLASVKVHIRKLRSKLEDDPQHPELIVSERSVGYKFVEPV